MSIPLELVNRAESNWYMSTFPRGTKTLPFPSESMEIVFVTVVSVFVFDDAVVFLTNACTLIAWLFPGTPCISVAVIAEGVKKAPSESVEVSQSEVDVQDSPVPNAGSAAVVPTAVT